MIKEWYIMCKSYIFLIEKQLRKFSFEFIRLVRSEKEVVNIYPKTTNPSEYKGSPVGELLES